MLPPDGASARDQWARLRLLIIGQLLAAPPPRGELKQRLRELSRQTWRHPLHGGDLRFGVSTLERWLSLARRSPDPAAMLATVPRVDAGQPRVISAELAAAIKAQYAAHPKWHIQLHYDNLLQLPLPTATVPSYATVLRFFRAEGLWRQREALSGAQRAAVPDGTREVRSFEATHVGALFHLDGHQGSLKVLNRDGAWITPIALCVIDDCSRLICHLQWYAHENTECLVHCVAQALQRRGLPRAAYSDNGSAMIAGEFTSGLQQLGILVLNTPPRSAWMNGKQETLWNRVEGRLLAMLDAVPNLTLKQLNDASHAWVEHEYHQSVHRELHGATPLQRFLIGPSVLRDCPEAAILRRHFRIQVTRTQRRSDGTLTLDGVRFEVPQVFAHLRQLSVRYARWDRSQADLVDPRTGVIQATLYPLDKTAHADGRRRVIKASGLSSQPLAKPPTVTTPGAPAPLLRHLLAQFAATGLPPAYLELDDPSSNPEPSA